MSEHIEVYVNNSLEDVIEYQKHLIKQFMNDSKLKKDVDLLKLQNDTLTYLNVLLKIRNSSPGYTPDLSKN